MSRMRHVTSLVCVGLGLLMQVGGYMGIKGRLLDNTAGSWLLFCIGTILFIIGLSLGIKREG